MFFLNIYIYLYISLLFIIYIRMYILQKKDKPRTAVQSIGPQTKLYQCVASNVMFGLITVALIESVSCFDNLGVAKYREDMC